MPILLIISVNVFYYGIKFITEIYSSYDLSNLKFNSIYKFKLSPELTDKSNKKKKRKRKKKYYGDPNVTYEDALRFLYNTAPKLVQERKNQILL